MVVWGEKPVFLEFAGNLFLLQRMCFFLFAMEAVCEYRELIFELFSGGFRELSSSPWVRGECIMMERITFACPALHRVCSTVYESPFLSLSLWVNKCWLGTNARFFFWYDSSLQWESTDLSRLRIKDCQHDQGFRSLIGFRYLTSDISLLVAILMAQNAKNAQDRSRHSVSWWICSVFLPRFWKKIYKHCKMR